MGVHHNARLLLQFNDLQDHIANGWRVPDNFYRVDVGRNRDRLLHETGIKHLHLAGRGSNFIVYLIELPERVIFLRIDNHAHLEDEPRGGIFRVLFGLDRT